VSPPKLVNPSPPIDDARCCEPVRQHRRPEGVRRPRREAADIARDGRDDARPHRQRYRRGSCRARVDDLAGTVPAGRHRPLRAWGPCLYLRGLDLSNRQIAREPDLGAPDGRAVTEASRQGLAAKLPPAVLRGEVEVDEAHVAAGHEGNPAAAAKGGARVAAGGRGARPAGARWRRTSRRPWARYVAAARGRCGRRPTCGG
jgi:hypothetical protein